MYSVEVILSGIEPVFADMIADETIAGKVFEKGSTAALTDVTLTFADVTQAGDVDLTFSCLIDGLADTFSPGYLKVYSTTDNGFKDWNIDLVSYVVDARTDALAALIDAYTPPQTPSVCRVTGTLVDGSGKPKSGELILFEPTPAPVEGGGGILVATEPVEVYVTPDGTFFADLVRSKYYFVTADAMGIYRQEILVPNDATVALASLV